MAEALPWLAGPPGGAFAQRPVRVRLCTGVALRPPAHHHLLISTGLTFGTISATYGFIASGLIDRVQFSVPVTVVDSSCSYRGATC